MKENPNHLLEKYLNGQCTREELILLLQYFKDEENEPRFKNLISEISLRIDNDNATPTTADQAAVKEVYEAVHAQIHAPKPASIKRFIWPGLAAALIIGLVTIGIISKYFLESNAALQYAITKNAQHKKVQLPDGTLVWLGPSSKLEFPESFTGDTRQVKLEGEAFFEVTKDKAHPFIIQSGVLTTRVLGTSFTIKSFGAQKSIMVTVLTGKVGVTARQNNRPPVHVELLPNQRVVYRQGNLQLKKEEFADAKKILEERAGNYEFKGAPVAQVLEEARRQYGVEIDAADISNCTFYGDLKAGEPVATFMKKLCLVINATWTVDNNVYHITTPGC